MIFSAKKVLDGPLKFFICDPKPLRVKNGIVTGDITDKIKRISLDELKTTLECVYTFSSLLLFPNPASNEVNVEWYMVTDTNDVNVEFDLFDVTGRLVGTWTFIPGQKLMKIDLTNISAGNYFLRMSNGKIVEQRKLVII